MASWSSSVFGNAWITMNGSWGNMGDYNMTITFNGASDYGAVETIKLLVCSTENGTYQTISSKAATTETLKTCTFSFDISDYITPVSLQKVYFRMQFVKEDGSTSTSSLTSGDMKTVFGDDEKATMIYVKANEPPSTLTFTTSNSSYQDFDKPLTISWDSVTKTGSYAPDHYKIWIRFSYDDGKTWQDNDNNYIATGWGVEGTSFEFTIKNLRLDTKNLDAHARFKLKILIATLDNPIGDIEAIRSSIKTFIMSQYVINTSSSNGIMKSGSDFITIKKNNLKQINGTVDTSDMKIKIMGDGSEWARIFWHDVSTKSEYFTSETEAKTYPEKGYIVEGANKYSRLGDLDNFIHNGLYEFMLCYPKHSTTKYNRWTQTADPLTTIGDASQTAETMGYKPVHIDFTTNWRYGLALSSSSTNTYMDCEAGHGNWFGAIGQYKPYTASGMNAAQKEVELWVRIHRNVSIAPKEEYEFNINAQKIYVSSLSELKTLRDAINLSPQSFKGRRIELLSDITMDDSYFTPITDFYGILDGKFHKIECSIGELESTVSNNTGTVELIKNNYGTIKNIILEGGQIIINSSPSTEIGTFCDINYGLIYNCLNNRNGIYPTEVSVVGGFCGNNKGTISRCICQSCIGGSKEAGCITGGIVGRNSGIIEGCCSDDQLHQGQIIGGICGYSLDGSIIRNCWSTATLDCTDNGYIGGIVGYSYKGKIINCFDASSSNDLGLSTLTYSGLYYGGICGYNNYGTYSNCYYDSEWGKSSNEYNSGENSGCTSRTAASMSGANSFSFSRTLGDAFISGFDRTIFPTTDDAHTFFYKNSYHYNFGAEEGTSQAYLPIFRWQLETGFGKNEEPDSFYFSYSPTAESWETPLILTGKPDYGDAKYIEITWGASGSTVLFKTKTPSYYNIISGYNSSWYGAHLYINIVYERGSVMEDGYFYPSDSGAVACFEKGTGILTKNGLTPIENVKEQDYVLSKNVETGQIEEQKVYHTYTHNPRSCL